MENEKIEEEKKEAETTPTSDEKQHEDTVEAPVEEKKPESEDIDFKKEFESLEQKRPERTPLEKAAFTLKKVAESVSTLGGDPTSILGIKKEEEDEEDTTTFAKKEDFLEFANTIQRQNAEQSARALARDEYEHKVTMWHYDNSIVKTGNITEDIENAHLLANKGRLKRSVDEIKRSSEARPGVGTGAGQKVETTPKLSGNEEMLLNRDGFTWNVKTKTYQAKHNEVYYNPQTGDWETRKIQR